MLNRHATSQNQRLFGACGSYSGYSVCSRESYVDGIQEILRCSNRANVEASIVPWALSFACNRT